MGFSLHAGTQSSTPSIEISLEDALGLSARWIVENHTDEARQLLDGVDTAHPDDPKILFLKGELALIRADYGEAVRLFRRILSRDPDLTRVRLWLARELFLARDFDAARYHFEIALGQGKTSTASCAPSRGGSPGSRSPLPRYRDNAEIYARRPFSFLERSRDIPRDS